MKVFIYLHRTLSLILKYYFKSNNMIRISGHKLNHEYLLVFVDALRRLIYNNVTLKLSGVFLRSSSFPSRVSAPTPYKKPSFIEPLSRFLYLFIFIISSKSFALVTSF